jgi:hypothetical protein
MNGKKQKHGGKAMKGIQGAVRIEILDPGGLHGEQLERDVRKLLDEMEIKGDIARVTESGRIEQYGLPGVEGLVINGRIVSAGSLPDRKRVRQLLKDLIASGECKAGD